MPPVSPVQRGDRAMPAPFGLRRLGLHLLVLLLGLGACVGDAPRPTLSSGPVIASSAMASREAEALRSGLARPAPGTIRPSATGLAPWLTAPTTTAPPPPVAEPTTTTTATSTSTTTTTTGPGPAATTTTTTLPVPPTLALAARRGVRLAPETSLEGYDGRRFRHWVDADGDGCDTAAEVLLEESQVRPRVDRDDDDDECEVVAGRWLSVYDGETEDDPDDLSVEHTVGLAEAWRSGASSWDADRRQAFANDLEERAALVAVTDSSRRRDSDHDPAQWRPARRSAWCQFAVDWVTVKTKWDLTVDDDEVVALREMLATC